MLKVNLMNLIQKYMPLSYSNMAVLHDTGQNKFAVNKVYLYNIQYVLTLKNGRFSIAFKSTVVAFSPQAFVGL